jgi:4-amino-4-deoxy-L-arabinose transferase-like glycosyltransferase
MNDTAVLTLARRSSPDAPGDPDQEIQGPHLLSSPRKAWFLLLLVFLAVHAAALFSPSLLDDADATHSLAAQHMARSGDWVTLYVNGVRYLEKPPLPYWLVAIDYHLFGYNVFATHLPMSLAVLACAVLGWGWARRAYGERAAFYTALSMLTTIGVFLFTRTLIPEALLTFLLGLALYAFLVGLEDRRPGLFYVCYASLALAVLAKGLIAPLFFLGAVVPYLAVMGEWRRWREFRLLTGVLLFLAIAAPWHVLAAVRNPDHGHPHGNVPSLGHVHGFLYFYFFNEHVLRFLGLRYPHDYNKQPWWIFWAGHVAWLFPWCMFFPAALRRAWGNRRLVWDELRGNQADAFRFLRPESKAAERLLGRMRFRARTGLLLSIYAGFILVFFSLSTNQEYYTFPAYLPLLILAAGSLARMEEAPARAESKGLDGRSAWLVGAHAVFAVLGIVSACALGYGLWASRKLPFVGDVGTLLAHRGVADYTLAMSHFFDLTGPSFAALRTPAVVAAVALLVGPVVSLWLRRRGNGFEATVSVGFTAAVFLIAAHSALVRFQPLLSSRAMADEINSMAGPGDEVMIYGDLPNFSSVIFYTGRQAVLINGRTSSMIWGSYYPDAPHIFLGDPDLLAQWGHGPRHFLCVPPENAEHVDKLLAGKLVKVQDLADRTLYTDKPL